eukprot:11200603-Lingulodinium_polyedra.AAC.1
MLDVTIASLVAGDNACVAASDRRDGETGQTTETGKHDRSGWRVTLFVLELGGGPAKTAIEHNRKLIAQSEN